MTKLVIKPQGKFKDLLENMLLSDEGQAKAEVNEVQFLDVKGDAQNFLVVDNFRVILQDRDRKESV